MEGRRVRQGGRERKVRGWREEEMRRYTGADPERGSVL